MKEQQKKLVHFGAGNIGRSFIGKVFSGNGYEVVFIDIDETVITELNRRRTYRVIIKRNEQKDEETIVDHVRAVDGRDRDAAAAEIAEAAYISTSVGKGALPHIVPVIAGGIQKREAAYAGNRDKQKIDIIIAENIREGAQFFRKELQRHLPPGFPLTETVGLVETSIGKMVPIMREEEKAKDPLMVFSEEYNTLILDKHGFLRAVPDFPEVKAVENITAYVDRKLFIHNMGHAAAAYLGFQEDPTFTYIWEPLEIPAIRNSVRNAMEQSGNALHAEYPDDLSPDDLRRHIDDLLFRFRNKALGDTIFRVGRDLYRKLDKNDRMIGAMLLAAKHGLPFDAIADAAAAGFSFRGTDEEGELFPRDKEFAEELKRHGAEYMIRKACGIRGQEKNVAKDNLENTKESMIYYELMRRLKADGNNNP